MSNLSRVYSKRALAAIGLQRYRSASRYILPTIGVLGGGLVIGAGVSLLVAPKQGRELREDIGRGFSTAYKRVSEWMRRKGRDVVEQVSSSVSGSGIERGKSASHESMRVNGVAGQKGGDVASYDAMDVNASEFTDEDAFSHA